ncbi:MAG: rod shape-determining protein MreC [Candidatus Eisenbacteria sp.]|nr:rod shape-determining protein MreC [Candidatus Eisenbacteria bacterium]
MSSVALMGMGESKRVESARRVRSVVLYPMEKLFRLHDRYADLESENRDLRLMVTRLVQETSRLEDLGAENERLRRMLGFKERGYRDMVPAEVIGWDESTVGLNLEIDQGSRSGIQPSHPVVSMDGLVGEVIEAHPRSSWVLTLRSPDCAVSVLDQRSRVRGIVRWRYPGGLTLQLVAKGSDVREGDMILTSGLGGVFPKGLRVGTVKSVEERLGDLFQMVTLHPVVDFDRLEEVAVLTAGLERESDPLLRAAESFRRGAGDSAAVGGASVGSGE